MNTLHIRTANISDARFLLEIYRPYVEYTSVSFEYEVPSIEEFENRILNTLKKYPYLVAEYDNSIVGYCYAGPFKGRRAYDWSVETTVYVRQDMHGKGWGAALYKELESILYRQHVLNVNACIAYTDNDDPFLTNDSKKFHEKCGYSLVGIFHKCGYKFDRWYDMIWMEKMLGEHKIPMSPFIPFPQL